VQAQGLDNPIMYEVVKVGDAGLFGEIIGIEGDSVSIGSETGHVLEVSGHTIGHIAYCFSHAAFTGDSLMALGCGRVFEGTMPMMWKSLCKLAALPPETLICSGHEYSATNARFALTIEPGNPDLQRRSGEISRKLAAGEPTVPVPLGVEIATNPFLRAHLDEVKAGLNMPSATDEDVFAEIRRRRNAF